MPTQHSGPLPDVASGPREEPDTGSVYDNVRAQVLGGIAIGGVLIAGATAAGGFLGGPLLAIGVAVAGSLLLAGLLFTGRR
jgi:hypothetical protein